jgi:hypothetical protein
VPQQGSRSDFEKWAPFLAPNNLKPFIGQDLTDSTKPLLSRFRLSLNWDGLTLQEMERWPHHEPEMVQ